jgi:transposase-like protein
MEIVGRVSGRRRWTVEQKLAILRDAFGPGGSVRAAIEQHEVGPIEDSQLFGEELAFPPDLL